VQFTHRFAYFILASKSFTGFRLTKEEQSYLPADPFSAILAFDSMLDDGII